MRLKIKSTIGMRNVLKLKSILGIHDFEEVDLVFELFRRHDSKTMTMFDVGAHHGGSLKNFAIDGWRIFAFEPDDNNRKILVQACKDFPLVSIDSRAVSDKNMNLVQFYKSDVSTGISGLSGFDPSHEASQTVDTVSLTNFVEEHNISAIDFLKIDTEGFDLMVLKGFPWGILDPNVILCEFEDKKTQPLGYTFYDISDYLIDKGYFVLISEWYPVVRYGVRPTWRCFSLYPCDLVDKKATGNIIAVKDPALFEKLNALAITFKNKME